ncbi:MAG: hypothetical protein VX777_05405, partial [Chlamydiota bacterium]|nr:hypothetical protein [Chlamydiota bacterium]
MHGCWSSIKLLGISFLFSIFLLSPTNEAHAQADVYQDGPVHEAFMTASTEDGLLLQAVARTPPAPIREQQPPKCHNDAIWIAGYWAWIENLNDFVWISGVWRLPPEGHIWIPGYWYQYREGWAWIKGFWSKESENQLRYISERPPKTKVEDISNAPSENHFWIPGYWEYNHSTRDYEWLSGQWHELNPNWVYVPGYYLWRPGGYLWVPGYWDLTLEERGCAYAPVTIPISERPTISFTPSIILTPEQIIKWCFVYYPNYTIFLMHHWHFHPDFWNNWCCIPPWWGWNTCWCFNWTNTWALWWWWTNPGFPQPPWITINIAGLLPPPSAIIINWIGLINPPIIISPWGV